MRIKSQIYLIILTFYPMIITNLRIFFLSSLLQFTLVVIKTHSKVK